MGQASKLDPFLYQIVPVVAQVMAGILIPNWSRACPEFRR